MHRNSIQVSLLMTDKSRAIPPDGTIKIRPPQPPPLEGKVVISHALLNKSDILKGMCHLYPADANGSSSGYIMLATLP